MGEITLAGLLPRNRAEGRLWRSVLGMPTSYNFSSRTFSTILSRLKVQGLVAKGGEHRRSGWLITSKGKSVLNKNLQIDPPEEDGIPRLVMYDIPESAKRKREWLRGELIACNFKQLQKSVWLGYSPLSEKFIKTLDSFKLKGNIHIVSIHKSGTLEEV